MLSQTFAQSENSGIDSLAGNLVKCIRSGDKDKILLNTDRNIYAAGETVYFKAYPTDALRNHLRTSPKKLYVDLVDKDDNVLSQLLLNAAAMKTNGDFKLNDSLKEGFYWLRAYTKQMIDDNIEGIGITPVYVVNAARRQSANMNTTHSINTTNTPMVQLFPEGGSLMSGITTTVGVKLTDENGSPLATSGFVKDSRDTVATFVTNEKGLGRFSFSPSWFGKYSLYIQRNGKVDSAMELPSVNPYAAQLSVTDQNDQFATVRVALEDSLYSKDYTTYLIALHQDSLCFASVGKGMYNVNVPLNNFPRGVTKLLLFNKEKKLLSERDIYVNKENHHLTVTTDKQKYAARQKADLNIVVKDANDKPLLAALTVSVTEMNVADSANRLQADPLENLSAEDADLVMLTTKQEDEICKDTQNEEAGSIQGDDTAIEVTGIVYDAKKQPLANNIVSIIANSQNFLFTSDTTDTNGRFAISLPDYTNTTDFKVQVSNLNGKKEDKFKILYDKASFPQFKTPENLKKTFALDKEVQQARSHLYHKYALQADSTEELNNVKVQSYKKEHSFNVITSDMIGEGANMISNAVLRIPGVHYVSGRLLIGGLTSVHTEEAFNEPLIVMDGVEQNLGSESVISFLNSLSPKSIGSIEVLTGAEAAQYGVRGGNGVILVRSAQLLGSNAGSHTGLSSVHPSGFYEARPFNMPDYSKKETLNSQKPDTRTTIYWNGDIITDKDGKATLHFFTADAPATYLITVNGISANGDKLHKTITINRR